MKMFLVWLWLILSVVSAIVACIVKWKVRDSEKVAFFVTLSVVSFIFALFVLFMYGLGIILVWLSSVVV